MGGARLPYDRTVAFDADSGAIGPGALPHLPVVPREHRCMIHNSHSSTAARRIAIGFRPGRSWGNQPPPLATARA
ncbi:hypothetical protein GCM10014713_24690 [Streptomyces purpureus]|uniref:Uncharacterized protein n=1 Tax=Streptomyces purpureus TaxID=1951 RepID=A0A918LNH5_9ACTN|nr:hypothetical protein GCM10014713_24690 [Streptomyces purpureus]